MEQKLVDHLVSQGLVSNKQMQRCVLRASMNKGSVVDELIDRVELKAGDLAASMADYWGLEYWVEPRFDADPVAVRSIAQELAERYGVLPVERSNGEQGFKLAVYDVEKARPVIEQLRNKTGMSPSLVVTPRDIIFAEITRHYSATPTDQSAQNGTSSASSRGVVLKKKGARRSRRPDRTTTGPGGSGIINKPDNKAELDDGGPTRQVDLSTDNPFLDLVEQTAQAPGETKSRATREPPTRDVEVDDEPEFFDDEPAPQKEQPPATTGVERASLAQLADEESSEMAMALDEFSDALNENPDDLAPVASSSSVNWGGFGGGEERPRTGSGSRPDGGLLAGDSNAKTTEESAIFPVERDGFFSFEEASEPEELTLAQVVERQRKIIDKLEREIDYQKGILQTMAELLVEARVLSKKKLKRRLKAFKESQRKSRES